MEENTIDPNSEAFKQVQYRFSASRYQLQSPNRIANQNTIVPQDTGNYPYPNGDASNIPTTNIDTNHATNAD